MSRYAHGAKSNVIVWAPLAAALVVAVIAMGLVVRWQEEANLAQGSEPSTQVR
jgi:hypothetical protein